MVSGNGVIGGRPIPADDWAKASAAANCTCCACACAIRLGMAAAIAGSIAPDEGSNGGTADMA